MLNAQVNHNLNVCSLLQKLHCVCVCVWKKRVEHVKIYEEKCSFLRTKQKGKQMKCHIQLKQHGKFIIWPFFSLTVIRLLVTRADWNLSSSEHPFERFITKLQRSNRAARAITFFNKTFYRWNWKKLQTLFATKRMCINRFSSAPCVRCRLNGLQPQSAELNINY